MEDEEEGWRAEGGEVKVGGPKEEGTQRQRSRGRRAEDSEKQHELKKGSGRLYAHADLCSRRAVVTPWPAGREIKGRTEDKLTGGRKRRRGSKRRRNMRTRKKRRTPPRPPPRCFTPPPRPYLHPFY
eukprot:6870516-Pyramimonas_sp.AAC.1